MATHARQRLAHIKTSIATIREALAGLTPDALRARPILSSGFRYELLVISEASRNLPLEWKNSLGSDIPWRKIEDLGNRLRHAYHDANTEILWSIYQHDLDPLEAAIDRMLAAQDQT